MQLGLIGLGTMDGNMSRRWLGVEHAVVGNARHAETVEGVVADGAIGAGATSLEDLVARLPAPRIVWPMVPAASVDATHEADFAGIVLSAMRFSFGGHRETGK